MNFPLWPAIKNALFSFCQHIVFIFPFYIGRIFKVNSGSVQSFWPCYGQKYSVTWQVRAGACNSCLNRICSNSQICRRRAVYRISFLVSLHTWKMSITSQTIICPWLITTVWVHHSSSSTELVLCICLLLVGLCHVVRTSLTVLCSIYRRRPTCK